MDPLHQRVAELVDTRDTAPPLAHVYAALLDDVCQSPFWSPTTPQGLRIPWRAAAAAKQHPSMHTTFSVSGLYLFGADPCIPLYLGMTTGPLWKRLFRRYLGGAYAQCQLAATYQDAVRVHGIDGFPPPIREWYRHRFGTSTVRLDGAVTFARHGIDTIWVTLLPIHPKERVRPLERQLIPIANAWNTTQGYPPLINKQDRTPQ